MAQESKPHHAPRGNSKLSGFGSRFGHTDSRSRVHQMELHMKTVLAVLLVCFTISNFPATAADDPNLVLQEAERLAWLKAWPRAGPLFEQAERLFRERGDERNALYSEINALRGRLHRLPIPEASEQFAEYLENPRVQSDAPMRLRVLVLKGETDEDLDPSMAEQSWQEAMNLAKELGDSAWANRALGELGVVAFQRGDISSSVIQLTTALKVAETSKDAPSMIRWLTLFGHGYVEMGQPEQALKFYERALATASAVPGELVPVMTYLGQGDALVKAGQPQAAEAAINRGLAYARQQGALGYQAELTWKLGLIAAARNQTEQAIAYLQDAKGLALQAGGNRIIAGIALDLARLQRAHGQPAAAVETLTTGIEVARTTREAMMLPKLLAAMGDLRAAERQYEPARELVDEASDLLEGLLVNVSSPWIRGQLLSVMNDVILTRVRLEGAASRDPERLWSVIEQARGRSLSELLVATPVAAVRKPPELRAGERELSKLQAQLFHATKRRERQQLLDQIAVLEDRLAPFSTQMFDKTRSRVDTRRRGTLGLKQVQGILRPDEHFLEYALADPNSYVVVVSKGKARVQQLAGKTTITSALQSLIKGVRSGEDEPAAARALAETLVDPVQEIAKAKRLIVSADGDLHQLPFELLVSSAGERLLRSHVVSYSPSGSVLALLKGRPTQTSERMALAVSGAGDDSASAKLTTSVTRGIYDVDASKLPPLPAANDETRAVASILGASQSTVLIGQAATEAAFKRAPLDSYRVIHLAAHGIPSTKFPARSAILLQPGDGEDGLLQAREILGLRLHADLVTLSACDTGTGAAHGQEGVANLVRPVLAAGARSVVANIWAVDDNFSLSLMRDFYRLLAGGLDAGEAMRQAKLGMIDRFGPTAPPKLWSGVLVYGDSTVTVRSMSTTTAAR